MFYDKYLIPMNNGMVNKSPRTEMVGNGTDYRFKWESKFNPEQYDPETGDDDTLEAYYPGPLSMPLSAYGSSSNKSIIYQHDNLEFRGTRITDSCTATNFTMVHDVVVNNCCQAYNNQTTTYDGPGSTSGQRAEYIGHGRFVRVFKGKTEDIGEEVGIDYRKWMLSSPNGQALVTVKPKDDPLVDTVANAPLWTIVQPGDYENETGYTDDIIAEIREAFPDLVGDVLPVHMVDIHQPSQRTSASSKSNPAGYIELPDLFNIYIDDAKHTNITNLRASSNIAPTGEIELFRPCEWDHRNLFAGSGALNQHDWGGDSTLDTGSRLRRTGARVIGAMGQFQQLSQVKYNTTHSWNTAHCEIQSLTYDAGNDETTVVVDAGASPAFDPGAWDYYVTHGGRVYVGQGVLENPSPNAGYTFLIYQKGNNTVLNSETDWKSSRTFYAEGDITGSADTGLNKFLLIIYGMGTTEPYKSGVLTEQNNFLGGEQPLSNQNLQVGSANMLPFHGSLDELAIYTDVLTPAQVASLADGSKTPLTVVGTSGILITGSSFDVAGGIK